MTQPEAGPSRAPFNRIERLNEQVVADGRTSSTAGSSIAADKLPDDVITNYVRRLSNPDSLRGSFGWYRALDTIIAQDAQRKSRRLTMPGLAIGGAVRFGQHVGDAVTAVADDMQSVVIPGTGRFVAEEAPDEMLAALAAFLAPHRDGSPAAHGLRPHTAAAWRL